MLIEIKYKLVYNDEADLVRLEPYEYFDFKGQEKYSFDDTPKHLLIEDYLNFDKSEINYIKLHLRDKDNYLYNEVNFWDKGKMSSINYIEYNYDSNYFFKFFKLIKEFIKDDRVFFEYINFYHNKENVLELRSHVITDDQDFVIEEIKESKISKYEELGKSKIY